MVTFRRLLLCGLCLLAAASAHAQVQTGSITGTVTDASDAVLPGATITLTRRAADRRRRRRRSPTRPAPTASIACRPAPTTSSSSCRASGPSTHDDIRISAVVRRDGQRQAGSRQRQRDDHGHRRIADRRHQVERAADRDEPGDPRRRPDRPRSVVAGQADSRRAGRDLRRRRHAVDAAEQPVGARLEHQRRQLQHRRRDGELAGRRRRRDDAVLRPGHVRRGQLHDLGDSGRSAWPAASRSTW